MLVSQVYSLPIETSCHFGTVFKELLFTAEELQALKEEFQHHQDKLDQFYSLIGEVEKRNPEDDAESKLETDKIKYFLQVLFFFHFSYSYPLILQTQ